MNRRTFLSALGFGAAPVGVQAVTSEQAAELHARVAELRQRIERLENPTHEDIGKTVSNVFNYPIKDMTLNRIETYGPAFGEPIEP